MCIVESYVDRILKATHEDHGHFAPSLTLDFLVGRAYCATRVEDAEAWVRSCHSGQTRLKKPIRSESFVIQGFDETLSKVLDVFAGNVTKSMH